MVVDFVFELLFDQMLLPDFRLVALLGLLLGFHFRVEARLHFLRFYGLVRQLLLEFARCFLFLLQSLF